MRTELVTIDTDSTPIDGAYYTPDDGPSAGAVLLMHGNMMNFYVGAPRFLPPYLTALGYSCLAFNRRGHDILSTRDSRDAVGGAFQTAAESIADNEFAAGFLAAEGFSELVVAGHSNGGMLATQFAVDHPETVALVLLSAHGGGREMQVSGFLAGDRTAETIAEAEAMVADGRGDELILVPGWWYVLSAASFVDRMFNTPDTLRNAPKITCPSLFIRGSRESAARYPAERFRQLTAGDCELQFVEDCDHFYLGRETVVAELVHDWLARTLPRKRTA